jgi:hypothetical protein
VRKKISTTSLSKTLGIPTKELFAKLLEQSFIVKEGDNWLLTEKGKSLGGEYRESKQYGKYIVWPDNLNVGESPNEATENQPGKLLTSTSIGKHFDLSAKKINDILLELRWLKKGLKGYLVTEPGKKLGGLQVEDKKSGIPFVLWPEAITQSLNEAIEQVKGAIQEDQKSAQTGEIGFREKYEAKHRAADGHFVRSKAEMLIDNWLYMAEIVHAYERKLPIEEEVYCDFYIPTGKVYIEYWGYENDPKYLARKKQKVELYKKYGFNLIEIEDKDVQNLDDILPRLLLKHGVQAY